MKILKMSFCFFLTAIFILMITGCGKEEPQEAEIEGYREEQVELPYKDTVYTSLIQRGESIRIADTYGHCLTSMDNGKTLSGFMKKINRDVKCLNIDKLADLDKALEELGC